MRLTKNDDMIQALAADRPDQPFGKAILPRRGWCGRLVPHSGNIWGVIAQEGEPSLAWRLESSVHTRYSADFIPSCSRIHDPTPLIAIKI
jgi:hypothetical protein